jgi:hypothetical protein
MGSEIEKQKELWVLRETDGMARFYIQKTSTADGILENMPLEPGEPIFAPKNGETTRSALKKDDRSFHWSISELRTLPSWPANIPEL